MTTLRHLLRGFIITLFLLSNTIPFLSLRAMPQQAIDSQVAPTQANDLPDLIIEKIEVSLPVPTIGSVGDITITIKNIGSGPATDFRTYLYVNPVDSPPTLTTTATTNNFYGLDPISTNGFTQFTRTGHTFTSVPVKIYAWVDRDNKVVELNEANNLLLLDLTQAGDAYEDDSRCSNAKVVAPDSPEQTRNLFRNNNIADVDWIMFHAKAGETYLASATATGIDTDLIMDQIGKCDAFGTIGSGQSLTITVKQDKDILLKIYHNLSDYGPDNGYKFKLTTIASCKDTSEPNDMCTTHGELSTGSESTESAFCTENDVDWYKFRVVAGAAYRVNTTNLGNQADVDLQIFENCTSEEGEIDPQLTFTAAQAGAMYVRTKNKNNGTFGANTSYSITVEVSGDGQCYTDAFEEGERNDQRQNARLIAANGSPWKLNACPAADSDWIKFVAEANRTYTIETFDLESRSDTRVCLYDSADKQVTCDDDSGSGLGSRIILQQSKADTYYVHIEQMDKSVAGSATSYSVHVIPDSCSPDSDEPDNQQSMAKEVTVNSGPKPHNICGPKDEDWIKFMANAQSSYVVSTAGLAPDADTILEIYDSSGNRLAVNDDYCQGAWSGVNFFAPANDVYFARVILYNPTLYGKGTDYLIGVRSGKEDSCLSNGEVSPADLQEDFNITGTKTLILVNPTRMGDFYSQQKIDLLMNKLTELAGKERVNGEIVRLDQVPTIKAAYESWIANGYLTNVGSANDVSIRIREEIKRHTGLRYIILVGDDRVLPFYRVYDQTGSSTLPSEKNYEHVTNTHPAGMALRQNYYLTDDYYGTSGDAKPGFGSSQLYLPDLSVGRLIETPDDMINLIDQFIRQPQTNVERVLVTGTDFVTDLANSNCNRLGTMLLNPSGVIDCSLIGDSWSKADLDQKRITTLSPFVIQSINGHAVHFGDQAPQTQTPDKGLQQAAELLSASGVISGGLIYSPGCHGGLNVPPENIGDSGNPQFPFQPLDLPEVFARRTANYVGNTGYGYGQYGSTGLSERILQFYTQQIDNATFGEALLRAKQQYYRTVVGKVSAFDEKVLQQFVYYGLPMFSANLREDPVLGEEFPGVDFGLSQLVTKSDSLGPELNAFTATVNFSKGIFRVVSTNDGSYLTLSDNSALVTEEPIQPLYYRDIPRMRSVVLISSSYTVTTDINPLVLTPINEYASVLGEKPLSDELAWFPAMPVALLQSQPTTSTLVTQLGQYNAQLNKFRQIQDLQVQVLSSNSSDFAPPKVTLVGATYFSETNKVRVKVGARDRNGVARVLISYVRDITQPTGKIESIELTLDPSNLLWVGEFDGTMNSQYFVQAVDKEGNAAVATNKGRYYSPGMPVVSPGSICNPNCVVYLPVIRR